MENFSFYLVTDTHYYDSSFKRVGDAAATDAPTTPGAGDSGTTGGGDQKPGGSTGGGELDA